MGKAYRARDTKLDRDVALKILPEALASDPDRLARLEREAKILATLNHPSIGATHRLDTRTRPFCESATRPDVDDPSG